MCNSKCLCLQLHNVRHEQLCVSYLSTVTKWCYTLFITTNLSSDFKKKRTKPPFVTFSPLHSRSTAIPMEQVQHLQTILQQVPLLCQLSQIQWTIRPLRDMEIPFTQPQVFFSFSQFLFCIFAVKRLWHGNGYHSPPSFLNHLRWLDLWPSMKINQSKLCIKPAWFHSILKLVPVWPREALSILTFQSWPVWKDWLQQGGKMMSSFTKWVGIWKTRWKQKETVLTTSDLKLRRNAVSYNQDG